MYFQVSGEIISALKPQKKLFMYLLACKVKIIGVLLVKYLCNYIIKKRALEYEILNHITKVCWSIPLVFTHTLINIVMKMV